MAATVRLTHLQGYHRYVRRFHQTKGVVLGYDETAFPQAAVQALRDAWRAQLPARTMPFLRADAQAPAALLVSLGTFPDFTALAELGRRLGSREFAACRKAVADMFANSRKRPVEFQFRCDVGKTIVRGRFVPARPLEAELALCALELLATELVRVGLPDETSLVEARYDGVRWIPERAHGLDRTLGRRRTFRLVRGVWRVQEER